MAWHHQGALRHDDRADALALGVAYFTDRLNVSQFEESKKLTHEAYSKMISLMTEDPERFTDELVRDGEALKPAQAAEHAQNRRPRLGGNASKAHRALRDPHEPQEGGCTLDRKSTRRS